MHHKDLESWKQAINLVTHVYEITKTFPQEELYSLVSQIRRSAISIPSNIAEGCARTSNADTLRFIDIALGSIAELDTQMLIAQNLGYLKDKTIFEEINKTSAMVSGIKKFLKQSKT